MTEQEMLEQLQQVSAAMDRLREEALASLRVNCSPENIERVV
jgi:hypothetical protein